MKEKMKITVLIIAIIAVFAVLMSLLIGMTKKGEEEETQPAAEAAQNEQQAEAPAQPEAEEPAEEPAAEEPKEPFVADRSAMFELIGQMNVGWNLGNSLDAHGVKGMGSETYWGNPKTTQEMVDAIREEGFNTIRIPVTFAGHVGGAPDYTIDPAWLDRVQEVVDYAVNADMFILLDTHHEPDFWLIPTEDKYDAVSAELKAIWTQVAERFKDYNEKLFFEGMNEPRTKGTPDEWNGGTDAEKAVITKLNQDFIDAVRATGGNNATRCLVICAYGNNGSGKTLKSLVIPEDNNIAVAVHMYAPYTFTYQPETGNVNEWDGSQKQSLALGIKEIYNYLINKGVPAIITEFGAVHKTYEVNGKMVDNEEEVIKWLTDYMHTTEKYGIPCVWWDNNIYDKQGEKFGIFDRANCTWFNKNIADTLVSMSEKTTE